MKEIDKIEHIGVLDNYRVYCGFICRFFVI